MTTEFTRYRERFGKQAVADYILPRFRNIGPSEEIAETFDLEQFLDQVESGGPRTWFVLGPAGSGKTTLTTHLAIALLTRATACLRIDVRSIKELTDPSTPLDAEDIVQRGRPADVDGALWKSRAKKHRVVLLIDGVNELRRLYGETARWTTILRLLAGNHSFPVLATSRHLEEELQDLERREVMPLALERLNEEEIGTYLQRRGLDPVETLSRISANKMEGATWNPFFLKLLADHLRSSDHPEFPRSRAALLDATIRHASKASRLSREEQQLASTGLDFHAVACAAALPLFVREEQRGHRRNIVELLERVWGKNAALDHLTEAFLETYMVERADALGDYAFLHDALIDFGLSLGYRNRPPPAFAFDPDITDQFLGDWVGLSNDPNAAARLLVQRVEEEQRPELLIDVLLANRSLLDETTQDALWRTVGSGLLLRAERSIQEATARRLSALPRDVLMDGLRYRVLGPLQAEEPLLAEQARHALLRGTLSAEFLQRKLTLQRLTQRSPTKNPAPTTLLASAPSKEPEEDENPIRGHAAIPPLLQALQHETDRIIRSKAARALGRIGDRTVSPHLLQAIQHDADPLVRGNAARALGRIGDRTVSPHLLQAIQREADPFVRGQATIALGQLDVPTGIPLLVQELLTNTVALIRQTAAIRLGQLGDRAAVPQLTHAFLHDSHAKVRKSAFHSLQALGGHATLPTLAHALQNESDPHLRRSLARTLINLGDRAAIPHLAHALRNDSDPRVRLEATKALGHLGDRAVVPHLAHALLNDSEHSIRGAAATALGHLGDRAAVPHLIHALQNDSGTNARSAAISALGRLGDRAAVPHLIHALQNDSASHARSAAATALGHLGDRAAVPHLIHTLQNDSVSHARSTAATALGRLGDRAAVPHLIHTLQNSAQPVLRSSAATALSHIGDRSAFLPLLQALLQEADIAVRSAATTALRHIGDRSTLPLLSAHLKNASQRRDISWRLRGVFLTLTGRYAQSDEDFEFLERSARHDYTFFMRAEALRWLVLAGRASDKLLLFLLFPPSPRKDGREHDPAAWLQGAEAVATVLRRYDGGRKPSEQLIPATVALLARPDFPHTSLASALATLRALPLDDATRALEDLTAQARRTPSASPSLLQHLDRQHEALQRRVRIQQELRSLREAPEALLKHFKPGSTVAPGEPLPQEPDTDVAIVTALDEETAAILAALSARKIPYRTQILHERYYYVLDLPKPQDPGRTVRVVLAQGTQKGSLPAQALTTKLVQHFGPRWILLAGICGGLDERGASIGDVIVAQHVFHYESEKLLPEASGLRPTPYACDPFIHRAVHHLKVTGRLEQSLGPNKLLSKDYASGDKTLAFRDTELRGKLLGISHDVVGFEMEAPGVLHALHEAFKGDQHFAGGVVKAVCDLGDEHMDAAKKNGNRDTALQRFAQVLLVLLPELDRDAVSSSTVAV